VKVRSLDARLLLQSWSGRTLATYTGAPNTIISVLDDAVLVGTTRSPQGEPVPLAMVQDALDLLVTRLRLRVDVGTLGHRSAFCGAVLLTLAGAVRVEGAGQQLALHGPRRLAEPSSEDRGAIADWWERDGRERFWMEITDRPDIGTDLHCPQRDATGRPNPGYSMILFVREDDVLFHYDRKRRAVTAWSRVAGTLDEAPIVWTSHRAATRRRLTGAPRRQPGWAVDLEGPFLLERPLSLNDLRTHGRQTLAVLDRLAAAHGRIYAPFYGHGAARTLRPTQYYLNKLPADLIDLLATMREATPPPLATPRVGTPRRKRTRKHVRTAKRVVELDFEAIERGTAGHEATEERLDAALRARGIEPLEPTAGDPKFDLAWQVGDVLYVAEIKSTTPRNLERQLRLGLGQVLRYRHLLAQRTGGNVRAVLVSEREPDDDTWATTTAGAGVALIPAPRIEVELERLLSHLPDGPPRRSSE
jgi:hypothetical protein